jgi:transposase
MLQPVVRRTWAARGQTPIQRSWERHDRLSVVSALTVSPGRRSLGLYFQIHDHNIRTEHVLNFLLGVRRRFRRGIIVVLDRWSVHRSAVRRLLERHAPTVDVEWLPAYAPELNPVEQVWSHTKYADLVNYLPDDIGELRVQVSRSIAHKRHQSSLLRSFFRHAQLKL